VIEELKQVQEFWLGAGVHGFSIDSANLLVVNLEANTPDKEKIKVKKMSGNKPVFLIRIRRIFIGSRIKVKEMSAKKPAVLIRIRWNFIASLIRIHPF
jgi:hypothetical protein